MAGLSVGCSDDPAVTTDAGTDAGALPDGNFVIDVITPNDVVQAVDAQVRPDEGFPIGDTGAGTDTGTATDVATPADAGTPVETLHGCTPVMYTDRSALGDSRVIAFGGVAGFAYSPKCLTIAVGQAVTFAGPFSTHPLRGGLAPSQTGTGAAPNPITNTDTGSEAMVTFTAPGLYPYYCNFHQPSMVGVIQVR